MNAIELFHGDGKSADVWYCATCRCVARTEDAANLCCKPNQCACGAETPRGWQRCQGCERKRISDRAQAIFAQADKRYIGDHDSDFVYVDDWDEYLDLDQLEDRIGESIADHIEAGGRPWEWEPPAVYATRAHQPMLDIDGAIDSALDDAFDGARDQISTDAEKELAEFAEAWSRKHMPMVYFQNEKLALVPWPPELR